MNASESEEDSCNERTALMGTESPSVQPYDQRREPPRDPGTTRVCVRSTLHFSTLINKSHEV